MKGGDFAKIKLDDLAVISNYMKAKELKDAIAIIKYHKENFERIWNEYFNQR
ncbi:MAG: DUF4160 domain-containing protein [Desulfobulbaceae bacterium]|nr:DUF4160 domain-containing protein [Desulfobulbaceae bacterium]